MHLVSLQRNYQGNQTIQISPSTMTIFISSLCVDDSIRILVYDDSIYLGQDQTSLFTDQCLQIETLALTESFSMLLWLFGQKVLGPVGPITLMIGYSLLYIQIYSGLLSMSDLFNWSNKVSPYFAVFISDFYIFC